MTYEEQKCHDDGDTDDAADNNDDDDWGTDGGLFLQQQVSVGGTVAPHQLQLPHLQQQ